MRNESKIGEMIIQAKELEENTVLNMENVNNLSILISSNNLAKSKDKDLSEIVEKINRHIEDASKLTSELLDELVIKYN